MHHKESNTDSTHLEAFDFVVASYRWQLSGMPQALPENRNNDRFWEIVSTTIARHGAIPAFGALLQHWPDAPDIVQKEIQVAHRLMTQNNLALAAELLRVLGPIHENNISVVAFKGPVAAMQIHGSLAARKAGDLDLLVRPQDFDRTCDLLRALGYELRVVHEAALQGSLWHPERKVAIDLHWGIPPAMLRIDDGWIWEATTNVNVLNQPVTTFGKTDLAVVLGINASKEYWEPSLHQFFDLATLWAQLNTSQRLMAQRRAQEIGAARMLAVALEVSTELFHAGPDSAPDAQAPLSLAAQELLYWLQSPETVDTSVAIPRPRYFRNQHEYYMALMDSPWRRWLLQLKKLLEPNAADHDFIALPSSLSALYFFIRPVRIVSNLLRGRRT